MSAEPQAPAPPGPPPLLQRLKRSPVTFALAAINVLVFVMVEREGSSLVEGTLLRFGAVERTHVLSGETWRVLTPMFLHIGLIHLVWNTYASFGFCTVVEAVLGRWRFLAVYLASGIGGAAASAIYWDRVIGAGASGAMFGILGATIALRYRILGRASALVRDPYIRSMAMQIGIWTLLGVYVLKFDHAAHFGGLAFGVFGGLAATSRRRVLPWAVIATMLGAEIAAATRPGAVPDEQTAMNAADFAKEWAAGDRAGYVKTPSRAFRLADLACRAPAGAACVDVALAFREAQDEAIAAKGRELAAAACTAGARDACR